MIDTHAHFNSRDIVNLENEIEIVNGSNLTALINVGLDLETSKEAIDIGNSNKKFFSSIGIHPLSEGCVDDIFQLYNASDDSKIAAIGEIGLDIDGDVYKQTSKFIESIKLANLLKLPIIIHSKGTNQLVINILKENKPQYGFVFHCFQPEIDILNEIINLGGYISVGTPITRPNAVKSLQVIRKVPIEHLLIELDYPYMSNSPTSDGRDVFNVIRKIRDMSKLDLEKTLDDNAKRLFKKMH